MKNNKNSERIAKVIARDTKYSRREVEKLILDGRVKIDETIIYKPNVNVTSANTILLDNKKINFKQQIQLYKYYKPRGFLVTHSDPENRNTIFDNLPKKFENMITVGRLDYDSEGLLLMTNSGDIKRKMELPNNNWKRIYRVRVYGKVNKDIVLKLRKGLKIKTIQYKPIDAKIDNESNSYTWLTMSLTEGKNREIRNIFEYFGMSVTRLIRVAYGPYKLNNLIKGEVAKIKLI
ncbi:rRNA pseudouridine synthase [Pelagibacteraceae bacterium]|nr:rRNA pseudouridine synthase [Pelagibacteraceae bacterium]